MALELQEKGERDGWKVEFVREGRSISRLWILDVQMRIGSGIVAVGGIAGVGTDRDYRNQGLASRVLNASLALMRREGYDAFFLFGIPALYHRFGFATCMPEHNLCLDTREAERAPRTLRLRLYRKADRAAIARLYNRQNGLRTGTVVRDPRTWKGIPMGSGFGVEAGVQVAVDGKDRVRGYVVYDAVPDQCRSAEVGGEEAQVFDTLLWFLARRALALRREEISLSLPPDPPFALYCQPLGCQVDTRYLRNAGPMGRIINLESCLKKLLPQLGQRWQGAQSLGNTTDLGAWVLRAGWGGLQLKEESILKDLSLKQEVLTQLLMGYHAPGELLAGGKLQAPRTCRALLERLFPPTQSHMWWPDRF
ncbi:MAG: GNAT family N-acetyltransferase [Candidatus Handelsmanbacteria bacterium]|nr:GNAT family N-acetyltransferase [Candidatus Handelsmanbacteria bacterium]